MKTLDLTIITGASRGIGRNIFNDLAPTSKNIIGIGSSEKILELSLIGNATPLRADLGDYNATYYRTKELVEKFAPKTLGVVLCGAQLGEVGEGLDVNLELWDRLYKVNILGNLAIIQACKEFIKEGKTRIVWFGGGGAASPFQFGGYASSKAAVVRAVENLGVEFEKKEFDASIIALAPGAVETDMLAKVKIGGGTVKTLTDISEPTNFTRKFLTNEFDSKRLNGRFVHCRDTMNEMDWSKKDLLKLRRVE